MKNRLKNLRRSGKVFSVLFGAGLVAVGCGDSGTMPDFRLADVNPNSPSHNQKVSPRNFIGGISAWYFGHAT